MAAYLAEVRKLEKHFNGMQLEYTYRASRTAKPTTSPRRPPSESRSRQASLKKGCSSLLPSPSSKTKQLPQVPARQSKGRPSRVPPTMSRLPGDRVLLALSRQATDWILEIKSYLAKKILPEDEAEAERITRQSKLYGLLDGDLYRVRPNGSSSDAFPKMKVASFSPTSMEGSAAATHRPHPGRQGLPTRFLLAYRPPRCNRHGQELRSMPVPCKADPPACTSAPNNSPLMALLGLGAGHIGPIPSLCQWLSVPVRRHRQVHQVDGGRSCSQHPCVVRCQVHQGAGVPLWECLTA